MSWIDAGVNLLDPRFELKEVLDNAESKGVEKLLVISSTIDESEQALELCKHNQHGVSLRLTAGVHPHYSETTNAKTFTKLKEILADRLVSAVGECGLDFNRNFSSKAKQLYAFEHQLALASELGMGVYLHERDAFDEQTRLLAKYASGLKFMVAHCFTGNKDQLQAYLSLGCYLGITGWLCDEKRGAELRQASLHLPLSRLLLETDAPYLFPKTLRPKRSKNEPSNIPYIGGYLAQLRGESLHDIQKHAFDNAFKLFFNEE